MNAPIALFVYSRPKHLQKCIDSLLANPEAPDSDIFIFSDGPKREEHRPQVEKVRDLVRNVVGFKSVNLIARNTNLGLSRSIISGVTEILSNYESAVILEDDLVVSNCFLHYMNRALSMYREDESVASIHGYCYPVKTTLPETFFIQGADCWGWATWRRAWKHFDEDGSRLLQQLRERKLQRKFDFDRVHPYEKMLKDQIRGKNDSWAIRWYASAFLKGMFTLYPGRSQVSNIGFDGSGEHCGEDAAFENTICEPISPDFRKIPLVESNLGRSAFTTYFKSIQPSPVSRISRKLKSLVERARCSYQK